MKIMKRKLAGIMALLTLLLNLTGCTKQPVPVPVPPEEKPLPGKLVALSFSQGSGMVARANFDIRLNREEIEETTFWPEDFELDEQSLKHVPITPEQWADVEKAVLSLWPKLDEYQPAASASSSDEDVFMLDGGDYTNLTLTWETADGTVKKGYAWPSDRRALTLWDLLRELADPRGREIVWYEEPQLKEIYFTHKYRLNTRKNYSFQFYLNTYSEEEPFWELIYYLGKNGDIAKGYLPLAPSDWDAFLALAEDLQLAYFPEPTRSDDYFSCRLRYTDETSLSLILDKETEETLKQFFLDLIEQKG